MTSKEVRSLDDDAAAFLLRNATESERVDEKSWRE